MLQSEGARGFLFSPRRLSRLLTIQQLLSQLEGQRDRGKQRQSHRNLRSSAAFLPPCSRGRRDDWCRVGGDTGWGHQDTWTTNCLGLHRLRGLKQQGPALSVGNPGRPSCPAGCGDDASWLSLGHRPSALLPHNSHLCLHVHVAFCPESPPSLCRSPPPRTSGRSGGGPTQCSTTA